MQLAVGSKQSSDVLWSLLSITNATDSKSLRSCSMFFYQIWLQRLRHVNSCYQHLIPTKAEYILMNQFWRELTDHCFCSSGIPPSRSHEATPLRLLVGCQLLPSRSHEKRQVRTVGLRFPPASVALPLTCLHLVALLVTLNPPSRSLFSLSSLDRRTVAVHHCRRLRRFRGLLHLSSLWTMTRLHARIAAVQSRVVVPAVSGQEPPPTPGCSHFRDGFYWSGAASARARISGAFPGTSLAPSAELALRNPTLPLRATSTSSSLQWIYHPTSLSGYAHSQPTPDSMSPRAVACAWLPLSRSAGWVWLVAATNTRSWKRDARSSYCRQCFLDWEQQLRWPNALRSGKSAA